MDFGFSEEQAAVSESARAVFAGHATSERVAAVEAGEVRFDTELWSELAGANLLGLAVPEEYGGSGLGIVEVCMLLIEQGRRVAPVPLLATLVAGAMPVARFGTPEQKATVLPGVVDGSVILAAAIDPGALAGVDAAPVPVEAVSGPPGDGDSWRLHGRVPIVSAATVATRLLVPARLGNGERVGVFLVDPTSPGCDVARLQTTDRQEHGRVELDGVVVGPDDLLGGTGGMGDRDVDGEAVGGVLPWIAQHVTVALCALQLGVTQEAVAEAARYVTERHQFGKPLASFQGVALRAADAHIDTEAIAATMWQAAWRLSEGREATTEVAVAKWWAAEAGHRIVHAVQHLHGGLGADITYPIHRYFLWGKQIEQEMGAGPFQLDVVARQLVDA